MEQLIWSIVIIAFIIYTALKNRARFRTDTRADRASDNEHKVGKEDDRLGRYMEDLLGIEDSENNQQQEVVCDIEPPIEEDIVAEEGSDVEKGIGHFESPLIKEHSAKQEQPRPGNRDINHTKFPWGNLLRKDLSRAVVLSEIIGPPISKRKSHRLF